MTDEGQRISAKSWARAADSINKEGYRDGAANGQAATFQQSFDTAYKEGFRFGFELGIYKSKISYHNLAKRNELQLQDSRRINCQICIDTSTAQKDVTNLYNNQKKKNDEYLGHSMEMAGSS